MVRTFHYDTGILTWCYRSDTPRERHIQAEWVEIEAIFQRRKTAIMFHPA